MPVKITPDTSRGTQMEEFRIIHKGGSGQIEEKRSRFIAGIRPVHSEEEALAYIAATKKQYWDARHNCFA